MKVTVAGIAVILTLSPNADAAPQRVPDRVQVTDAAGDANYLMDRNLATPAQPTASADILKVWFTNDSKTITAHVLTAGNPMDASLGLNLQVHVSGKGGPPGSRSFFGMSGGVCLTFGAGLPGTTGTGQGPHAVVADHCDDSDYIQLEATLRITVVAEGTITSMTAPRSASQSLEAADRLDHPWALARDTVVKAGTYQGSPVNDVTPFGRHYRVR